MARGAWPVFVSAKFCDPFPTTPRFPLVAVVAWGVVVAWRVWVGE